MTYDSSNVFAKILKGELPADICYEDDHCLAFYDLYPKAKIHVLVIPKGAFIDIYDFLNNASVQTINGFFAGVKKVINILNLSKDGFRVSSNAGKHGCQEVPHFHMHIMGGQQLNNVSAGA